MNIHSIYAIGVGIGKMMVLMVGVACFGQSRDRAGSPPHPASPPPSPFLLAVMGNWCRLPHMYRIIISLLLAFPAAAQDYRQAAIDKGFTIVQADPLVTGPKLLYSQGLFNLYIRLIQQGDSIRAEWASEKHNRQIGVYRWMPARPKYRLSWAVYQDFLSYANTTARK